MKRVIVLLSTMLIVACGPAEMGPAGPAGPTGPQGPKGDKGEPGIGLTTRRLCFGTQSFGTAIVTAVYTRYNFADGSAFVHCELDATNLNPRRTKDSLPLFLKAADPESRTGKCEVRHTVPAASGEGSGTFEFLVSPAETLGRAIYHSNGSDPSYDGTPITLECQSF